MTRTLALLLILTILLTSTNWSQAAECTATTPLKLGQSAPCDGQLLGYADLNLLLEAAHERAGLKLEIEALQQDNQSLKTMLEIKTCNPTPWYFTTPVIALEIALGVIIGGFAGYGLFKLIEGR